MLYPQCTKNGGSERSSLISERVYDSTVSIPIPFLTAISPPVGHTAGDADVTFQEEIGYMQNFSWKVSKHIAAICKSTNGYSILIVLILRLLLVVKF